MAVAAAPPVAAAAVAAVAAVAAGRSLAEYRDDLRQQTTSQGVEVPTLDESELDRTAILFSNFDTNSDGVLDFSEFQQVEAASFKHVAPWHTQSQPHGTHTRL